MRRVDKDTIRGEIFPFVGGRTHTVSVSIECRTTTNPNNLFSISNNAGVVVNTI